MTIALITPGPKKSSMSKLRGKSIAISPFRRLVIDLMHFSTQVPSVTLDRRMDLSALANARQMCDPRPTWTALFVKGYSLVAARQPLLRRSYMSFPWPRFYEHPKNIVNLNVSRQFAGEDVVLATQIRSPENRSLTELDGIIQISKNLPIEECPSFRRVMRLSHWPKPIRRYIIWATINCLGRRRGHNLGTCGITSVADRGAGILNLIPLATSTLHYGLFDEHNCLDVRFAFDHRVLDGAPAADALASLEQTLLGEILNEVELMGRSPILPMPEKRAA